MRSLQGALAGRRIVVTRAPEQSQELLDRLRDAGAEALSLPLVRFLEPEDAAALDGAIGALDEFDWLVLTSANVVRFFLARCRKTGSLAARRQTEDRRGGAGNASGRGAAGLDAAFHAASV